MFVKTRPAVGEVAGFESLARGGEFHIVFGKPASAQGPRVDEVLLRISAALD